MFASQRAVYMFVGMDPFNHDNVWAFCSRLPQRFCVRGPLDDDVRRS